MSPLFPARAWAGAHRPGPEVSERLRRRQPVLRRRAVPRCEGGRLRRGTRCRKTSGRGNVGHGYAPYFAARAGGQRRPGQLRLRRAMRLPVSRTSAADRGVRGPAGAGAPPVVAPADQGGEDEEHQQDRGNSSQSGKTTKDRADRLPGDVPDRSVHDERADVSQPPAPAAAAEATTQAATRVATVRDAKARPGQFCCQFHKIPLITVVGLARPSAGSASARTTAGLPQPSLVVSVRRA